MPTTSEIQAKRRQAANTFVQMRDNLRRLGNIIKLLMRHPDATNEQLIQGHITYSQLWLRYQSTRAMLRAKWPEPARPITRPWPWNTEDTDV